VKKKASNIIYSLIQKPQKGKKEGKRKGGKGGKNKVRKEAKSGVTRGAGGGGLINKQHYYRLLFIYFYCLIDYILFSMLCL
jgi:hypothetical protein